MMYASAERHQDLPAQRHQLVVAEPRQGPADPHDEEDPEEHLEEHRQRRSRWSAARRGVWSQWVNGMSQPPKKSVVTMAETVTMLAYSAMKNIENFMALYSVWYPAISSDSASGMSNGSRLVSAKPGDQEDEEATGTAAGRTTRPSCCARMMLAEGHVAGEQQHRHQAQPHRHFVGDHLRAGAQPAQQRVLAVGGPAGERDAVDAQRADRPGRRGMPIGRSATTIGIRPVCTKRPRSGRVKSKSTGSGAAQRNHRAQQQRRNEGDRRRQQ